jgi:peptide-methionine (S)-S-oxide reductase
MAANESRREAARRHLLQGTVAALMLIGLVCISAPFVKAAEQAIAIPPPTVDESASTGLQTVVLAGGCFWGVQGVYQHTKGGKILQIYFSVVHNPTELNRQGPDFGTQYRSAIFYANDEQKRIAAAYIAQLQQAHVFSAAIVTKLEPLTGFYPAENYHQDFLVLHPSYPYIVFNDLPKVDDLKQLFPDNYRATPVTVMAASRPTQ